MSSPCQAHCVVRTSAVQGNSWKCARLKSPLPNTSFSVVCDPVMGDEGRLYLPPDMVPLFRDALLPLANVLTPNCFEAELLTGLTITDDASAVAACDALHERGPHTVVCNLRTLYDTLSR